MNYNVTVKVMPLKELLDPQGKAVLESLKNLGLDTIEDVRMGKNINLKIEASNESEAHDIATNAAIRLLSNPVIENFEVIIKQ